MIRDACACVGCRIQWLTVLQPRRDLFDWANFMMDFTRTRVVRVGDRKLSRVAPKV